MKIGRCPVCKWPMVLVAVRRAGKERLVVRRHEPCGHGLRPSHVAELDSNPGTTIATLRRT